MQPSLFDGIGGDASPAPDPSTPEADLLTVRLLAAATRAIGRRFMTDCPERCDLDSTEALRKDGRKHGVSFEDELFVPWLVEFRDDARVAANAGIAELFEASNFTTPSSRLWVEGVSKTRGERSSGDMVLHCVLGGRRFDYIVNVKLSKDSSPDNLAADSSLYAAALFALPQQRPITSDGMLEALSSKVFPGWGYGVLRFKRKDNQVVSVDAYDALWVLEESATYNMSNGVQVPHRKALTRFWHGLQPRRRVDVITSAIAWVSSRELAAQSKRVMESARRDELVQAAVAASTDLPADQPVPVPVRDVCSSEPSSHPGSAAAGRRGRDHCGTYRRRDEVAKALGYSGYNARRKARRSGVGLRGSDRVDR